jgi:formamidopyrimidine-DNA glycosylase
MPELPDLEVFAANLNKRFKGKTLKNVEVGKAQNVNVDASVLKKAVEDQSLKEIYRKGKTLELEFGNKSLLELHLMLNGEIKLFKKGEDIKYNIVAFLFSDDQGFAFTDFQGIAKATLNPDVSVSPDALSKEMDFNYLKELLQKKRSAIKQVLLDQKVIRGIGNAYADEILYDARISPFSISKAIPEQAVKTLASSIRSVLLDAVKNIKKASPDLISGEVRDFLKIHHTKNTQSPSGAEIKVDKKGARKTYYTDEQELYK